MCIYVSGVNMQKDYIPLQAPHIGGFPSQPYYPRVQFSTGFKQGSVVQLPQAIDVDCEWDDWSVGSSKVLP